jgi:hypothetical protein
MDDLTLTVLLACIFLIGIGVSVTEIQRTSTLTGSTAQSEEEQTPDDSLDAFQDRMVEVGTWVFDHNGLRGEVDRGDVTWSFADDGTVTVTDSDETHTRNYSLTKYCGGYGKIKGGNEAYLKIQSDGGHVDCYIVAHLVEISPPEGKVLALSNDRGNSLYLIPTK